MEQATTIEAAMAASAARRDTEEYKTWLAKGEAVVAKAKKAGTKLVGLTITGLRCVPFDIDDPEDGGEIILLDLSDGSILYAQSDPEGNAPGILCSEHHPRRKRQVQYYGNDEKPGTVYGL